MLCCAASASTCQFSPVVVLHCLVGLAGANGRQHELHQGVTQAGAVRYGVDCNRHLAEQTTAECQTSYQLAKAGHPHIAHTIVAFDPWPTVQACLSLLCNRMHALQHHSALPSCWFQPSRQKKAAVPPMDEVIHRYALLLALVVCCPSKACLAHCCCLAENLGTAHSTVL